MPKGSTGYNEGFFFKHSASVRYFRKTGVHWDSMLVVYRLQESQ
jgi:hypothetical protein